MRVLVLGAGVVGVASAWYLAEAGHQVTVLDRQPGPGLETSFANGGQISVSHAEPWSNPGAPLKILRWLGSEEAPLLFRPRADWQQWSWGLRFLRECLPWRTRRNTLHILELALYSRSQLQALRRATGISYDHLERGILHLHSHPKEFDSARARVALMRDHGLDMQLKTAAECLEIEPALRHSEVRFIGGTYAPSDESGDAHAFTRELAALCAQRGVQLTYDTQIDELESMGGRISGIHVRDPEGRMGALQADIYVLCLGSYTPLLTRSLELTVPVYPVKGYSVTIPIERPERAPTVCLTDESHKLAMSRLGNRLRVAGTAELTGYSTSVNRARCDAILKRVQALFPSAGDISQAQLWAGLRPATPSNVPIVSGTRYPNLYLNTGHGTLGWTLACGSGRILTDLVNGKQPEVALRN